MKRGNTQMYEQWLEEITAEKPKTTDDCFTPDDVYAKVLQYCIDRYGVEYNQVVRPFFPGGDFEKGDYTGKVVIDNPPFSIMKKIITFYQDRNIPFFLFCSGVTVPIYADNPIPAAIIATAVTITYSNGAKVNTSFVTNLEKPCIRTDSHLYELLNENKRKKKIQRPDTWLHVTDLNYVSARGVEFNITPDDIIAVHTTTPNGYKLFGRCFELKKEKAEEWKRVKEKAETNGLPVKWL